MIVNQNSPAVAEFRTLFDPLEGAEVAAEPNNTISLKGLSAREVVLAFPGVETYTAVLVHDPDFAKRT